MSVMGRCHSRQTRPVPKACHDAGVITTRRADGFHTGRLLELTGGASGPTESRIQTICSLCPKGVKTRLALLHSGRRSRHSGGNGGGSRRSAQPSSDIFSSKIWPWTVVPSTTNFPTVTGSLNRRGPALPGLK